MADLQSCPAAGCCSRGKSLQAKICCKTIPILFQFSSPKCPVWMEIAGWCRPCRWQLGRKKVSHLSLYWSRALTNLIHGLCIMNPSSISARFFGTEIESWVVKMWEFSLLHPFSITTCMAVKPDLCFSVVFANTFPKWTLKTNQALTFLSVVGHSLCSFRPVHCIGATTSKPQ